MQLEICSRLAGEGAPGVAMTSEQFQRVKELTAELAPLSAPIKARCGDDSVASAELEKVLDRNDEAQGHIGNVARQVDSTRAPLDGRAREMTGRRVGPYQVRYGWLISPLLRESLWPASS